WRPDRKRAAIIYGRRSAADAGPRRGYWIAATVYREQIGRLVDFHLVLIGTAGVIASCQPDRRIRQKECHRVVNARDSVGAGGGIRSSIGVEEVGSESGGRLDFVACRSPHRQDFAVRQNYRIHF